MTDSFKKSVSSFFHRRKTTHAHSEMDRTEDSTEESIKISTTQKLKKKKKKSWQSGNIEMNVDKPKTESECLTDVAVTENMPPEIPSPSSSSDSDVDAIETESEGEEMVNFYLLHIVLKEGRGLAPRDLSGTSDPYVKFRIGSKLVYTSKVVYKNLNPTWNEEFTIPLDDLSKCLNIEVYDKDILVDDAMGCACVDLESLIIDTPTDLKISLMPNKKSKTGEQEVLGDISLKYTLHVKNEEDFKEQFMSDMSQASSRKDEKHQEWKCVVTVVLIEGKGLLPMDVNGLSDPYVKLKLCRQRHRSKVKDKTLDPQWFELFHFYIYDDTSMILEMTILDRDAAKDDLLGKLTIDLTDVARDYTHTFCKPLDSAGTIKFLATITAIPDSKVQHVSTAELEKMTIKPNYSLLRSFNDLNDVGWLKIQVLQARHLQSANFGGKSDPFCVIILNNCRVRTCTQYNTLDPNWNKTFYMKVEDIHSVLDFTVYDEDKKTKRELLGKVVLPLLQIRCGERKWYSLKDSKLQKRTRGAILLEIDFVYNQLRALYRTLHPREELYFKPEVTFKPAILKEHVDQLHKIGFKVVEGLKFVQSCFSWESKLKSTVAFVVYCLLVWHVELYMVPLILLLLLMINYVKAQIVPASGKGKENQYEEEEEVNVDDSSKSEKVSLVDRFLMVQDIVLQLQVALGMMVGLFQRIKNVGNWTVPWLSTVACISLVLGIIVLYYVPIRVLLLLFGVKKFTKKLRNENAKPHNEFLDFLSRAPTDHEKMMYRELCPEDRVLYPKLKK